MSNEAIEIAAVDTPLTTEEREDLKELEAVIERGQRTFVEVGLALGEIQKGRLYRATHGSFEAYLAERWPEIGRRMAYRLIDAAEVAETVNHGSQTPVITSERQARPLVGLPPEQQRAAVQEATQAAGGKAPTGKQIEQAAAKFKLPSDFNQVRDRAAGAGWTLTHDGPEFVLTPTSGSPVRSDQWGLVLSKVNEITRPAPVAAPAPPPPLPMPAAAPAMPPPLMMTPLAPPAGTIDQQDLIRAAVCVAYCEAQAAHARARLVEIQQKSGIELPAIELPGDAIGAAARITVESSQMRMQLMGLMISVKVAA